MRRAAVASVALLATVTLLTGCQKEEAEKLVAPLVADAQETPEAKKAEEKKSPLIPEIDDNLSIEEGARIAVVSKCKKGEFWDKVKEGMEAAVKDVNEAYGFKKDKQITMTFEGPDNEEDVESQINTLDAVIAENPSVVCLSAGDMDSCQAQLEAAKENGIPVIAFDSNVSDTKLVRAFRGTDNTQIGKYAAYKLGSAIGKMGNVAIFSAQEKTQSSQERVKGFLDNIANYTDIKVVETVYSDQVDDMKEAMKEVLDKYPALDGVFCTNANVSEMFLEVNKDNGENKVAMIGVDATSKQQEAIKNGDADYAVLPIENSTAGIVADIYDLLVEYHHSIVGEQIIQVDHALMGLRNATLEDIKTVYSHPQALSQCRKFLEQHPEWKAEEYLNTAMAAKKVKEDGDLTQAAIASPYAAQCFGLQILKPHVFSSRQNSTRFIIVSKEEIYQEEAGKISVCFEIPHESGSLYNTLSHFIYNDLNMTKIESRPIPEKKWEYRFFVDFEGNLSDSGVKNALYGISREVNNLRILGNY